MDWKYLTVYARNRIKDDEEMGFYIVGGSCIGIGVQLEIKGTIYGISIHSNCSDNL